MTSLPQLSKSLRHIADLVDELLSDGSVTYNAALVQTIRRNVKASTKKPGTKNGFKYRGTHWTQRPENRKYLLAMNRRTAKARKAKAS